MTVEKLREEANAMERLTHRHILKLVGTYTLKKNHLYLLLYPAAVCDLHRFLKDIDDIKLDNVPDQDDAFKRLHLLGLEGVGTIDDLPLLRTPKQTASAYPRTATAAGYLQQTLGCMTEALGFVHKQDIRHGDLNPKNILLSPGRLYLADFGIARDVKEAEIVSPVIDTGRHSGWLQKSTMRWITIGLQLIFGLLGVSSLRS
jgi:serine/threonine protein kinase